jgi:asparagine synthase (glutamine-hydrolysing)
MCGICGAVAFDGQPVARDAIQRGCAALVHRGPDHTGTWFDDGSTISVGLGATRLAILDPLPAGHQPMHSADGRYHLAFNGEIYNYHDLRRELSSLGRTFVTNSDTEVVLAACAEWGKDAFQKFNGMWALAFYDRQRKCGFLSRDRFGIKPLIYAQYGRQLLFASELRALTQLGKFDRGINRDSLIEHLTFGYITHPRTIYRGAKRLPPGCVLAFDASGASEPEVYYDVVAASSTVDHSEYGHACGEVRSRLASAVVGRRVSDVPIGAFLSGGLDSSIIVSHLAEATGQPVQTFAVGYEGHTSYDERHYARSVAARFGTEHREVVITERDAVAMIPRVLDHLGEPVGDSSIIPTALLSEFVSRHVTVALSGDGGDELFGGYWRYLGHDALATYRKLPRMVRRLIAEPVLHSLGASRAGTLANRTRQFQKLLRAGGPDGNGAVADEFSNHIAWSRILAPTATGLFADPRSVEAFAQGVADRARAMTTDLQQSDPLNRIFAFDLQHQLPADMLQKVDLASMMFSLEVRVPFLDPGVVSYAHGLPSSFKIDRGRRKRILVDAYRGRLPDEVLERSKRGFEVPFGEFLRRGEVSDMFRDTVTREAVDSLGGLDFDGVTRLYQDHLTHRNDHADVLFALLSLCWWATAS